jgi:hypothetical protein
VDPFGLHCVRVLAGLLFLYWLLPFAGYEAEFFSLGGWFDGTAFREISRLPGAPAINWSLWYAFGPDTSPAVFTAMYWLCLAVLVLFTLGVYPRVTAVLSWVVVASCVANPAIQDEADWLLPVLAFYLMLAYILAGQRTPGRTPVWHILGPAWPFGKPGRDEPFWRRESVGANVALRLLQVHFAIIMVTSGLHKLQFGDWWAGLALWYPLHPPLETGLAEVLAMRTGSGFYFFLLSVLTYAGLAWQLAFPAFAWRRGWCRAVLLGGAAVGCLSMAFLYRIPVFGPLVLVFCLAYLTPTEWHRLTAPLARLFGRGHEAPSLGRPHRRGAAVANSAIMSPR